MSRLGYQNLFPLSLRNRDTIVKSLTPPPNPWVPLADFTPLQHSDQLPPLRSLPVHIFPANIELQMFKFGIRVAPGWHQGGINLIREGLQRTWAQLPLI